MMEHFKNSLVHVPRRYPRARADAFTIRAIQGGDADAYRSVLQRTSEEDRYCRFFHVVNHYELDNILRFVTPAPGMWGLIAEAHAKPLGVAHAFLTEPDTAEIAIVVADDARRRGVGRALLERLIADLRTRGCDTLTAFSLPANGAFARLARSVGMAPAGTPSETMLWKREIAPA